MASLDINIVIIAIPSIGKHLKDTSLLDLLWVLLGYQVVVGCLLVNFGRLADMFGRVKLYNVGFIIFTIGSALCSLSQDGAQLVLFRMVQGVGGAFLISNSAAIIVDTFPSNERGKALGINRVSQVAGAAGGLVLGGFLTTVAGWQAIFWVNVPIGIFGTVWSHYKLREIGSLDKNTKVDIWGNVTFAAGLASLLAGISLYALGSLALTYLVVLLVFGAVLFAVFMMIERRAKNPMLDLSLFVIRPFSGGTFATFLNSLARGCVLLVMTLYLQGPAMALDPLVAGIFLLPNSISISIFGPISGWLSDRGGTRFYTTFGLLLTFAGFLVLAQIGTKIAFEQLAVPMILIGAGQGFFSSPNRASVMSSVPPNRRGVASSVNSTMLQVGNSFSRAFSFLIMGFVIPGSVLQTIFSGTITSTTNPEFVSEFVSSLHLLFYVCAAFMILSIVPSILRGSTPDRSGRAEVLDESNVA
jgi:EmrB/QacA subfamily drug resistance transporter